MVDLSTKTVEQLMEGLDPRALRRRDSTLFNAKLTFAERCEIVALYHMGATIPILAAAFGLHRRTLHHMTSLAAGAKHYKDVRNEYLGRGHKDFIKTYVTEAGMAKVNAAVRTKVDDIALTATEDREQRAKGTHPNKRKDSHAGHHNNEAWGTTFEVAWKDSDMLDDEGQPFPDGWYWCEGGSTFWQGSEGGLPYNSSNAAYKAGMGEAS